MYTMDCSTNRNFRVRTLSSRIARAMGMGKKNTSWIVAIISVLPTACQNRGSANSRSNWAKPTQGLPRSPSQGLYSWNAMMLPRVGV